MARSVTQLKEEARRAEQREEWSRAIDLYLEALQLSEESGDISLDLSLYNRIGDLYRRGGEVDEAVRFYRKAVEQYAEEGLHTGAVALCNKILRLAPDEVDTYRVLGRLHASSGLAAEARNAFREYADRMEERGDRAAALDGYVELARMVGDVDLLVDVVDEMVAAGREEEARSVVREVRDERQAEPGGPDPRIVELAERLGVVDGGPAGVPAEPAVEAAAGGDAPAEPADGEPGEEDGGAGEAAGAAPAAGDDGERAPEEDPSGEGGEGVELEEILLHEPGRGGGSGHPAADAPAEAEVAGGDRPDDAGDTGAPADTPAGSTADDRQPSGTAPPRGPAGAADRDASPDAGDATEPGAGPPERAGGGADTDGPVHLGERIRRRLEGGRPGDVGGPPVPEDFDDMLVGFRAQAAETSGEADPEAHVELGVALRQMGLLDDAIREFQVAARAPDPPVRAFEALGECFLEKGLHSVAVRVLNRALRLPGHQDHELLGVLYQLGVAYQSVEEHGEALDCFERVYSVDIDFRDVAGRMEQVRSLI